MQEFLASISVKEALFSSQEVSALIEGRGNCSGDIVLDSLKSAALIFGHIIIYEDTMVLIYEHYVLSEHAIHTRISCQRPIYYKFKLI